MCFNEERMMFLNNKSYALLSLYHTYVEAYIEIIHFQIN